MNRGFCLLAGVVTLMACATGALAKPKVPAPTPVPAATDLATDGQGLRAFAWWIDDADTLERKTAIVGLSAGRWEGIDGHETSAPVLGLAVGVTDALQLSLSVPYSRAEFGPDFTSSGRGDTYLSAKLCVLEPDEHTVGVAVTPMLEVLSDSMLADPTLGFSRFNWALPVSMQVGSGRLRLYATAGYFSRGAAFAGIAVERTVTDRLTLSATLNDSRSMHDLDTAGASPLSRYRIDATVGASVQIAPRVGLYVSGGRTVSHLDENGARYTVDTGLSFTIGGQQTRPASSEATRK